MSSRNLQLDGLRRQIDSLDDRIHDLLIERSSMIEQIIAAKSDGRSLYVDEDKFNRSIHARKMVPLLGDKLLRHVEVSGDHEAALNSVDSVAAVRELVLASPSDG